MIELNEKTQQDFLNREWVQRLLKAGVDMSDAKYCIVYDGNGNDAVDLIYNWQLSEYLPTYTVSELLYKLRNRYGIYTIFNCYRNLDVDNIPIIESFASILLQQYNETI